MGIGTRYCGVKLMTSGLAMPPSQGCGEVAHRARSTTSRGDVGGSLAGLGAPQRGFGNARGQQLARRTE